MPVTWSANKDWILRYIANRRNWLATNERVPLLRRTVYRMDEMKKLVDAGNWDLDLPITCRGVRIDATVLGGETGRISAHVIEERALALRMPMMQGSDVREIQQALLRAGEEALTADGVYGRDTDRAVRAFQKRKGLTVDGIVGPATRSALEAPLGEVIPMAAE
jgi:chitosanase